MLALEPRYVFDAALAATLDHAADTHHHQGLEPAAHDFDVKALASAAQSLAKDTLDKPANPQGVLEADARATDLSRVIENHNRAASTKEFVFIDSRLEDIETLVGDIPGDATWRDRAMQIEIGRRPSPSASEVDQSTGSEARSVSTVAMLGRTPD